MGRLDQPSLLCDALSGDASSLHLLYGEVDFPFAFGFGGTSEAGLNVLKPFPFSLWEEPSSEGLASSSSPLSMMDNTVWLVASRFHDSSFFETVKEDHCLDWGGLGYFQRGCNDSGSHMS